MAYSKHMAKCHPDRREMARGLCRACYHRERRESAIRLLGGECVRCGNDDIRVLELDHVIPRHANGAKPAANLLGAILRREAHGLQVLCANCHAIKTRGYEDG